jgi:hypothetical protein
MPHNNGTGRNHMLANNASHLPGQEAWDNREEDWSDYFLTAEAEAEANKMLKDPEVIRDCLEEGMKVPDQLCEMLAQWCRAAGSMDSAEIVNALCDSMFAECVRIVKGDA